jgi:hypothetical protein
MRLSELRPWDLVELRVCGHRMVTNVERFDGWLGRDALEHFLCTGEATIREQAEPDAASHQRAETASESGSEASA